MLRLVVFFREGKVPWGKSDLGIWLRLLIREEKSGNKLSSPHLLSTQWANQQPEFFSLIHWRQHLTGPSFLCDDFDDYHICER